MKKLIFFLFLAIVLASCCNSCDPINPPVVDPPVVIKQFTVTGRVIVPGGTITPSMQTVNKGGTAIFKIEPYPNGYEIDYLKDDGNILPAMDVYTVRDVSKDDTFEVAFKKDSLLWPLLNIVWQVDSVYVYTEADGRILKFLETNWTQSFSPDGTVTELSDGNVANGKWSINKTTTPATIVIGNQGTVFKIETLNENKMILSYINGLEKRWLIYSKQSYK